jgi:membrane fusion protein, copper/silver efflux system
MTDPELRLVDAGQPPGVRTMGALRWILVAVMGLVAAGSVLYAVGISMPESRTAPKTKLYYCPMHPQIVQDHPGECPICSMTLVPKPDAPMVQPVASARSVPGLATVEIPVDRVQKIGVRTAPVARRPLVSDLRTVGVVEANERGLAQISPRFSGWIEELLVSETGQRVKRGQPLATIYSPDVLQAQQELLTALGWSAGAQPGALPHHTQLGSPEGLVADARRRLELLGISPQEIDAIVRTRKPQRALPLRSPVDGHVIGKRAIAGMSVSPGMPLFEVADLSTVWVMADVFESDVRRVQVGQPARFEVTAYQGEVFAGKVKFVYPTVDPSSRTLRVRLEVRNRPGPGGLELRPGMYGNISLDLPEKTGLMVPSDAVVDTGEIQYVFVVRGAGKFEPRQVKVGTRGDELTEIISGVAEGDVVVTTANFLIDSESRLRAAVEGRR